MPLFLEGVSTAKILDSIRLGFGVVLTAWGLAIILGVLLPTIKEQFPEKHLTRELLNRLIEELRRELRDESG